jgi:hypothetical protein
MKGCWLKEECIGGIIFPNGTGGNCGICMGDMGVNGDMGRGKENMEGVPMPGMGRGGIAPGFCII